MDLSDLRVVAVAHPALDRDVERLIDDLRSEPRYFGPTARANPKPFPSLIHMLEGRSGFRLGIVECGRLIGLARVDRAGQLFIAVAADRRGRGVGKLLGHAMLERAIQLGYHQLRIRATARSGAIEGVAASLGCAVVVSGPGLTDVIVDVGDRARSA